MGDQLAGVYQLQGGIERYLQAFPDGGYWRGKNFVFDKREAFDVNNPDGDGGVLGTKQGSTKKNTKGKKNEQNQKDDLTKEFLPEMKCCVCQNPWNRYVGKKKCGTCGVPVLMCDSCMTVQKNNSRSKGQGSDILVRCPLCVEENVTMRAEEVEWTDNGVRVCPSASTKITTNGSHTSLADQKAAPSVLKWGGGHALGKKERRRFQRKPCKFGADCKRSGCLFSHPDREKS